jgi:hypothetical protein
MQAGESGRARQIEIEQDQIEWSLAGDGGQHVRLRGRFVYLGTGASLRDDCPQRIAIQGMIVGDQYARRRAVGTLRVHRIILTTGRGRYQSISRSAPYDLYLKLHSGGDTDVVETTIHAFAPSISQEFQ